MANEEHVEIVRQGTRALAEWKAANAPRSLDLVGADLAGVSLVGADLRSVDLGGATLTNADLRGTELVIAYLDEATLDGANLSRANLSKSNLEHASLQGCSMRHTDLTGTNLRWADLRNTDLYGANLRSTDMYRADLSGARFWSTVIVGLDLNDPKGLESVRHIARSHIAVDTLIRSVRRRGGSFTPAVRAFLEGAGVQSEILDVLPGVVAEIKYYSCFISYGEPDVEIASKLTESLRAEGVSCWLYKMDSTVGEPTWGEIKEKRRAAAKMVVLCSVAALVRDGVLKEIEEQIDEDSSKIVPISLDDLWKHEGFKVERGDSELKPFLLDKNYADFANLKYDDALKRLLNGLKRSDASS